jgi:membrane protease YdiL (CAAX protease family)
LTPRREAAGFRPVVTSTPGAAFSPAPEPTGPPWGFWASFGWLLALTGLLTDAQVATVFAGIFAQAFSAGLRGGGARPDFNIGAGVLFPAQMVAVALVFPATYWLARLARTGDTWGYLGYRRFGWKPLLLGAFGIGLIGGISSLLISEPNSTMLALFRDSNSRVALWITVVVLAPLTEEWVFRGFVFEGLSLVPGGAVTATLITSLLWASIHLQYSWREMSVIFLFGLVLGAVRHATGSVWPLILLHIFNNLLSCIGLEWELRHPE